MGKTKIMCIVGTRPQLLKVSRSWADIIVDTGQHYDKNMRPSIRPDHTIGETELGRMIDGLLAVISKERPSHIVVIGDTRSTLAGATAAVYTGIPLIHYEAGMRSGEAMVEEWVRRAVDGMSYLRLVTDMDCYDNLVQEGLNNIAVVGDVEYDAIFEMMPFGRPKKDSPGEYEMKPEWSSPESEPYSLLTLHRGELINNKKRMTDVLRAIAKSSDKFVVPVHPHTKKQMSGFGLKWPPNVKVIDPIDHKQMIRYILNARLVVTDSGGVQREARWLMKPVVIVRARTEHREIIKNKMGVEVGYNPKQITAAIDNFFPSNIVHNQSGDAHEKIKAVIEHL